METKNKLRKTIAKLGLVGLLSFGSSCAHKDSFMDGPDLVSVSHYSPSETNCTREVEISVEKEDGSLIKYVGGRGETQPCDLYLYKITIRNESRTFPKDPESYSNFLYYINMYQNIECEKINRFKRELK